MANYIELLAAHDLLQSRIDRAVEVLEATLTTYPFLAVQPSAEALNAVLEILKGEVTK